MRSCGKVLAVALIALAMGGVLGAQATGPAAAYRLLLQREASVRGQLDAAKTPAAGSALLKRMRALTEEYEQLSKTYRTSGYSDNALWQGAVLSGDAFTRFGYSADRRTARRLLGDLAGRFPSSSLIAGIAPYREQLDRVVTPSARPAATTTTATTATRTNVAAVPVVKAPSTTGRAPAAPITTTAVTNAIGATTRPAANTLTEVRRDVLPDAVRLTLMLEHETAFTSGRVDNAGRLQIDLRNTQVAPALKNARLSFADGIVRQVRITQTDAAHARIALDLERTARFSVYPMYGPYRLIVDVERAAPARPATALTALATAGKEAARPATEGATAKPAPRAAAPVPAAAPSKPATTASQPLPPAAGRDGYSLSRQLGLGAARIVIDPGHGGYDPGAQAGDLDEASLVLDVALRLERLLMATPGVEVILTRRSSEYVPLEERTAIANRASADLFLSIHANASSNAAARGIETYFLNFAPDAASRAIAARENAASSKTMRDLNEMVKTITLNDKIDESRDFAMSVQTSLYGQLRKVNTQARSLGVKQAPFQVLIGATMPSVLAEISFITNEGEGALLKTESYRQQIATALLDGVMRYQRSLKTVRVVSEKATR